jgi:peptidyl-prolyl cis-trans isomerase C
VTHENKRTLVLAFVVLGVFILFGVGMMQNSKGRGGSVTIDTPVVRLGDMPAAKVNGTAIYLSDVKNLAVVSGKITPEEQITPGTELFNSVLDELIDQRLMSLEANSRGLYRQESARRRLAQARERILGNVLVEAHLRENVTEEAALNLYTAQETLRDRGDEVRARQILVHDKETADVVMEQIEKGETFAALANGYSVDRVTRDNGGDLGYFTADLFDREFTRVAFNTPVGQVAGPFQTSLGWHIIRVTDRRKAREPTFEEVKDQIMSVMTFDEIDNLVKSLRASAEIERLTVQNEGAVNGEGDGKP